MNVRHAMKKFSPPISEITEITDKTIPPVFTFSLAVLWLWSGIQPVLFAPQPSLQLLAQTGIAAEWQWPVLIAASVLDLCFGIACLTRLRYRSSVWLAQFAAVAAYSLIIAVRLPEFWAHPFAPLVKNLPVMAMMLFLYQQTRSAR